MELLDKLQNRISVADNDSHTMPTPLQADLRSLPASITEKPVVRVNLRDYGFKKAGHHEADAKALENLFNQILNGYIIDENANEERQLKEQQRIDAQIGEIDQQAENLQMEIRKINETDIPKIQNTIDFLDDEVNNIKLEVINYAQNPNHLNKFNLNLYWLVFIPATIFLYLFYVSAVYSGFFRDVINEVQQAGTNGIASVLAAIFAKKAFTEFNLHWFAPVIFFVFGIVLHVAYEPSKWRVIKMLGTLSFILLADALLAYFVENKSHEVKVMMGLDEPNYHFYTSAVFYMVLVMGYCTCLGWSVILHQIKEEYGKKDVEKIAKMEIEIRKEKRLALVNQVQDLKALLITHEGGINKLRKEIEGLKKLREQIALSMSDLEQRITNFYDGWLIYVNKVSDNTELKNECDAILRKFYQQHVYKNSVSLNEVNA
jgi:hypothetical protein